MSKEVLKQICKMIASGEIPKEVYDKYLKECPIGFMTEEELFRYLTENNYKSVLDEIREYIVSKNNGVCIINGEEKGAYTFLLDFEKARVFVWDLLQILDKVK